MIVDVQFSFPDLAANVAGATEEINRFIAAQIQTNRGLLFREEGARNGHPKWAPLRMRSGQILARRGTLKQSLAPRNSGGQAGPDGIVDFAGDDIVIGTRLLYAAMMNFGTARMPGGVLRPKNAEALKIPLPQGTRKKEAGNVAAASQRLAIASRLSSGVAAQRRTTAQRQLAQAQKRLSEAKTNSSREKREVYLRRLEQRIRNAKLQDDQELAAKLAARHGRVKASKTGDFIFRKWVRIPERRFDVWNAQDQDELDAALANKVAEVIGR